MELLVLYLRTDFLKIIMLNNYIKMSKFNL